MQIKSNNYGNTIINIKFLQTHLPPQHLAIWMQRTLKDWLKSIWLYVGR